MNDQHKSVGYATERVSLRKVISLGGEGGVPLMFSTLIYPHRPLFLGSFRSYLKQGRLILQTTYILRLFYFLLKRGLAFDVIRINERTKHNEEVVRHNLWNNFNIFNFSRSRIERLLYLLELSGARKKGKTLSIGPKNEGEILLFKAHDFTDVIGIDLFTYCPSILVMDFQDMTFPDNTFDTINCGWVLLYAYDLPKAIKEITRVSKNGALVACAFTVPPKLNDMKARGVVTDAKEVLSLFGEHVGHVYFRDDDPTAKKITLVFQLKK